MRFMSKNHSGYSKGADAAEALLSNSVVLKQDGVSQKKNTSLLSGLGGLRFCCVANRMLVNNKHLHIYIYIHIYVYLL